MKDYLLYPLERLFAIWGNEVTDYTTFPCFSSLYGLLNFLSQINLLVQTGITNLVGTQG